MGFFELKDIAWEPTGWPQEAPAAAMKAWIGTPSAMASAQASLGHT